VDLISHHDGGGEARCSGCGALAVGPCARCHAPQCGDCCVLTEGGVNVWAICARCAKGGRGLSAGWWRVLGWIFGPILLLAAVVLGLSWAFGP